MVENLEVINNICQKKKDDAILKLTEYKRLCERLNAEKIKKSIAEFDDFFNFSNKRVIDMSNREYINLLKHKYSIYYYTGNYKILEEITMVNRIRDMYYVRFNHK